MMRLEPTKADDQMIRSVSVISERAYYQWLEFHQAKPLSEYFRQAAQEAAEMGRTLGVLDLSEEVDRLKRLNTELHAELDRLQAQNADLVRQACRTRHRTMETLRLRRWVSRT